MYLEHFGLNESPFRITPHTDFFFAGANRGAMLDALLYAITHDEGIVKVSGEVGTGKTMLCRVLMERLPAHVETIYLSNPSLSRDEILYAIADDLKLATGSERGTRVLRNIQEALIERFASGKRVVVLIDEAHAMPRETLEEIRLLSNLETDRHKLLQLVLFGQPELDDLLNTAEMRQLKERITHGFRLDPLARNDIKSYIDYRMRAAGYRGPNPFNDGAVRVIDAASKGLTRRINILADKSLLAAFAANTHAVGEKEARRAVADSDFYRPKVRASAVGLAMAGLLGGVGIGYGISVLLKQDIPSSQPASKGSAQPITTATAQSQPAAASPLTSEATNSIAVVPTATQSNTANSASPAAAGVTPAPTAPAEAKQPYTGKSIPAATNNLEPNDKPRALGRRAAQRFASTQQMLKEAPGKHYSIQLITVPETEPERLEGFLGRAEKLLPEQEVYVYSVKINGLQHYRVAYGNYSTADQVRAALGELPTDLKVPGAYFRSFERMRSQNSQ